MSRPSGKEQIVHAAMRVADAGGMTAVTIDAVAAEAQITKGGLLYHFPNRAALLLGIHSYLATSWDARLTESLTDTVERASIEDKVAAYVRVSGQPITRAELLYITDASASEERATPWLDVVKRWTPTPPVQDSTGAFDDDAMDLLLARVAADGLWAYEALTGEPLTEALKAALVERILSLIPETAPARQ